MRDEVKLDDKLIGMMQKDMLTGVYGKDKVG